MVIRYKTALFLLLFFSSTLFSSSLDIEKKICKRVLNGIFHEKSYVKIWSNTKNCSQLLEDKRFLFVKTPYEADILIVGHYENISVDKPIFVRKYFLLRKYKKRAIGGFYWQKGRPNIIFMQKPLEKFHITLPAIFAEYIESRDEY